MEIKRIARVIGNPETVRFLSSLGIFDGENIYIISESSFGMTILVKDARYYINDDLGKCITFEEIEVIK